MSLFLHAIPQNPNSQIQLSDFLSLCSRRTGEKAPPPTRRPRRRCLRTRFSLVTLFIPIPHNPKSPISEIPKISLEFPMRLLRRRRESRARQQLRQSISQTPPLLRRQTTTACGPPPRIAALTLPSTVPPPQPPTHTLNSHYTTPHSPTPTQQKIQQSKKSRL